MISCGTNSKGSNVMPKTGSHFKPYLKRTVPTSSP
jgi:hypothetical protein